MASTLPKPMHPSFPTTRVNMGTVAVPDFGGKFFQALKHAQTFYMSQRDDAIHLLVMALSHEAIFLLSNLIHCDKLYNPGVHL